MKQIAAIGIALLVLSGCATQRPIITGDVTSEESVLMTAKLRDLLKMEAIRIVQWVGHPGDRKGVSCYFPPKRLTAKMYLERQFSFWSLIDAPDYVQERAKKGGWYIVAGRWYADVPDAHHNPGYSEMRMYSAIHQDQQVTLRPGVGVSESDVSSLADYLATKPQFVVGDRTDSVSESIGQLSEIDIREPLQGATADKWFTVWFGNHGYVVSCKGNVLRVHTFVWRVSKNSVPNNRVDRYGA